MVGRTNAGGGGGLTKSTLVVQTDTGSVVTVTKGAETRSAPERFGVWAFPGLSAGEWTVKAVKDGKTAVKAVSMDGASSLTLILRFNMIPEFTFTGDYEIVDDNDNLITSSQDNWKIRFLTSGTLIFTDLRGAENGIDVFLVGGGGAGGGGKHNSESGWCGSGGAGGYTKTEKSIPVSLGIEYLISIGSGGTPQTSSPYAGNSGGETSAFGRSVDGGTGGKSAGSGGSGGSGGGGYGHGSSDVGYPGTDGGIDGSDGEAGKGSPGTGQGTTTREFGESEKTAYANGGTGKLKNTTYQTRPNHGDGGRGAATYSSNGSAGSSGIVIIRNHREGAA